MAETEKTICPACRNEKSSSIGIKNDFDLARCGVCGTIFARIVEKKPTADDEIKDLYDHYYDFAKFELPRAAEISLQAIVDTFEGYRKTNRFLDIGFGEGGLLTIAERNKWNCFGTELAPQSLEYGKNRGWAVTSEAASDVRFEKEGFDVVTMIELIEHVPNPDLFFETAFTLLRPGGLLFLTTPNAGSLNRRWLGTEWSTISPPEHMTIWSTKGMVTALRRNNFVPNKLKTDGFNPVEIYARFRRTKDGKKPEVNRNEAGFALNDAFSSSKWRRAVKAGINSGLSTLRIGDGLKTWAVKVG